MTASAAPLLLALFEPDIAQNTGAMMRTCACLGVDAAIIEPAGFRLGDSRFRRAAMDYINALRIESYSSWDSFAAWRAASQRRLGAFNDKGRNVLCGISSFVKWIFFLSAGNWLAFPRPSRLSADVRLYYSHSTAPAFFECGDRSDNRDDGGAAPNRTAAVLEEGQG